MYWWASDSNVDWNQALPEVRKFTDQHGVKTLDLRCLQLRRPHHHRAPGSIVELPAAYAGRRRPMGCGLFQHDPGPTQLLLADGIPTSRCWRAAACGPCIFRLPIPPAGDCGRPSACLPSAKLFLECRRIFV